MSPFVTSTLGVIFVLVAAVQVWLMLEDIGREQPRFSSRLLCVVMVQRVAEATQDSMPAW